MATDCKAGQYCKVAGCAVSGGTCTTKPTISNVATPVCGCDNVTYWNETVAGAYGVSLKGTGECAAATALKCVNDQCANDRSCNLGVTLPVQCGSNPTGTCWGLPPTCPPSGRFSQCGNGGGLDRCLSKCAAIRDERLHFTDGTCPQ